MAGNRDGEGGSDDMDVNDWTEVRKTKRVRKQSSISGSCSDGRDEVRLVRRRVVENEGFK